MKTKDIASMALHNLWSRKLRSILNLIGVVIGCTMLFMTFAGTRGASNGIKSIISRSEDVRKMMIHREYDAGVAVPDELLVVEGDMSDERRERIRESLRNEWLNRNARNSTGLTDDLSSLNDVPHVQELIALTSVHGRISIGETSRDGFTHGVSVFDSRVNRRVIAGHFLTENDPQGVLINESTAYRMGFRSDEDLQSLIGQEMKVVYRVRGQQISMFLQLLSDKFGDLSLVEQSEFMLAIQRLVNNLGTTDLNDREKGLIEKALRGSVSIDDDWEITESFTIRGVFKLSRDDDLYSFLNSVYSNQDADIYVDHRVATRIQLAHKENRIIWAAVAVIDDVRNLRQVVDEFESRGYDVNSAVRVVESVDGEIDKVRLAISGLALLILVITSIGISNTMIISVLERTPEFGIMKSLGAKNSDVLTLMLFEGALTGILGAFTAIFVSFGLGMSIGFVVRRYIEQRLGQTFDFEIFAFSFVDSFLIFLVASMICTIASLLPAYRAARLDPVVAMRRS